jgi:protein involved in polysaccharide export with SLBB domain
MSTQQYFRFGLTLCLLGVILLHAQPRAVTPAVEYEIFGAQLFDRNFAQKSYSGYNPSYRISIGDQIQLNIWGGLQSSEILTVDAQGNIFVPEVGPVRVAGFSNHELTEVILSELRKTFQTNVEIYANLVGAQDIKVYVTGFVREPGLVTGHSFDSVMYFLDQAGGIDPERGSYRRISVLKDGQTRFEVSLYDFLLSGELNRNQLQDGDTIFVHPQGNVVSIDGTVRNRYAFEFLGESIPLSQIIDWAGPLPESTHVSIRRTSNSDLKPLDYLPLSQASEVYLGAGDHVIVYDHTYPEHISVEITGSHDGPHVLILPVGGKLSAALTQISPSPRSNLGAIKLFRRSVAQRQKQNLEQSLDSLEKSILAARSATLEEARIRSEEADTLLDFIERARQVTFDGMVTLADGIDAETIFLEDGDRLHVPAQTSVVMVYGEVNFPNSQIHQSSYTVSDYIDNAGGLSPNANKKQIFLQKANGVMERIARISSRSVEVEPGDEIFILPKVPSKNLQLVKEISGIIYQLALGARVIVDL